MEALESQGLWFALVLVVIFVLTILARSVRIVNEYERGVVFRLGRVEPGERERSGVAAARAVRSIECTRSTCAR